jgi:SprB repeat
VKCFGGSDGMINLNATGGTSPYQYSSEPNNFGNLPKLTGFVAGSYTLYVKDANGCIKQTLQDLSQPTLLQVGSSVSKNVSCFEGNDGEIVATSEGGVSPYQYAIDDVNFKDSPNFKELKAKNFIVTVKDANNCLQKTSSVGISEPPLLVPSVVSQTDVLCFGGSDGKINTNASGGTSPYLYTLDGMNFETNQSFTGLKKQAYILSVKDSKGCVKTLDVTINQPNDLLLTAVYQDTIPCFKDAKGVAKLKVLGGTSGYVFSKNGTDYVTDSTFKNLTAGEYQFYVKDANQCEKKVKLQLTEPTQLNLNLVKASDPLCTGDENGKIELLASGGNLGYTYILDNAKKKTEGLFTDLAENEYALQVVDKKGCKQSITPVKLTNPKPLSASVSIENPKCVGDANGKITLNVVGGNFPYTAKNVSDSVNFKDIQIFEKLNAGTYRYSINDKNGCKLSLPVKLAEPQTLNAIVFDAPKEVCKGQVVTLDAKNPNRIVQWYRNGKELSKDQKIEISEPDQYSVSVKNTSGCEVVGKYTLVNNANLFNPDFLMAVQAFVGDTVVVLDISKPKPDETKWVLPADAYKLEDNVQKLSFILNNIGDYEISQLAKKGDCRNTKTRAIKIFKKEDVDNTDPKLGYKDLIKILKVDVSPNPNYGAFAVNIELNLAADMELTITRSTTSTVVYQDKFTGGKDHKFEVQLKNAPQDIYIVTIRAGALTLTKKVLVLN